MDERIRRLVGSRPIPPKLAERLRREMEATTVLTDREVDVIALYACGYNAPEIAGMLHLSEWTVYSHSKRFRMKLGARTMAHAVALALKRGELDPELVQ